MSLALQATIFKPDLTIRGIYPVLIYDLHMDALANTSSTFSLNDGNSTQIGDYIAVKIVNSNKLIYYGQITTVDSDQTTNVDTLTANYIWNLLNGDIIVKSRSGQSYEIHIQKLINQYISSQTSSDIFSVINTPTTTAYAVTNSEGVSVSNFIDYLIRGFKLHNVILDVADLKQGISNGIPFYYPEINIRQNTDTWNFKNDVYAFQNWQVADSRLLRGYNNELWIVDQASANMEAPTILARYWLTKSGSVVKSLTNDVSQPTQVQISLFDKTQTDNPSYDSIANSTLTANAYSHDIQFDMPLDNNFFPLDKLKLGLQANIYYNSTQYKSILSAFSLSSDTELIHVEFGNLRFGINDLFGNNN
ncbi:hypothetical protein ACKP2L_05270 [Oenococcus alcoholitolerans]|uniref:hypothetical protein n=1 Tax=Oenococcus alcoholitolerans TaxID=931074 RepID=UPI003F703491